MPVTKKQAAQMKEKVFTDEEEEGIAEDKPKKAVERERAQVTKSKDDEYKEALKDILLQLGSLKPDDLKQLTFISLKMRDPLAKGITYYDATLPEIETQCSDLLDWYIKVCKEDIEKCVAYIKLLEDSESELLAIEEDIRASRIDVMDKINANAPPDEILEAKTHTRGLEARCVVLKKILSPLSPPLALIRKKTFWDKVFGQKKVVTTPELEAYNANARKNELEERLIELEELKEEAEEIKVDTNKMYFKTWAYNYYLLCRSQQGDDNNLKMKVMLADGQIVNKQESGGVNLKQVFDR